MNGFRKVYEGRVSGFDGGMVKVTVDSCVSDGTCAGCSLSGSCEREYKGTGVGSVIIKACLPEGSEMPAFGSAVSVGLPAGGALKATLLLLVLPLAVFIAVAFICNFFGQGNAQCTLTAFASSGLCYVATYLTERRKTPWILIVNKKDI